MSQPARLRSGTADPSTLRSSTTASTTSRDRPRRSCLLALSRDLLRSRAREQWDALRAAGARLHTSAPVVIETFAFLDRNANRDVVLAWKDAITKTGFLRTLICELRDLQVSWDYFRRSDLHKLSAVDATSFAIMKRTRLRLVCTLDHLSVVGFRMVG